MRAIDVNKTLIDGYLQLLGNLSTNNKLDLIAKLSLSVKTEKTNKKQLFQQSFGAWESKKTADEMIATIKDSRKFNRKIATL